MKKFCKIIIGTSVSVILWGGCSAILHPQHSILNDNVSLPSMDYSSMPKPQNIKKNHNNASLWVSNNPKAYLFKDTKASNIGDIVTVRIVENAKASRDASTKTARDSSIATTLDAFLGLPTNNRGVKASSKNSFDGSGKTSRSGKLSASITTRVIDVLSNGNLIIQGRREILVNSETQLIILSGVIRPEDIGPNNVILSTYIADAKIEYTGKGIIDDKQRPGWAIRIFDWIWPF
ncbi:MAG: flagellar basal body L-ring protein FlgH [Nitrospirota bacterium]